MQKRIIFPNYRAWYASYYSIFVYLCARIRRLGDSSFSRLGKRQLNQAI